MIERFQINKNTKLCDFGCGPGLYTTPLAETGAKVTGIDFSERSINYAQKIANEKELDIEYINEDYLNFKTDKKFDLITMIYCDFTALSDQQRKILLASFYEKLEDDGLIFLDVYSTKHFENKVEENTFAKSSDDNLWSSFWSADPYYVFINIHKYEEKKLFLDKYVIIEENRTREIYNWIKCYSLNSIIQELENSGFEVINNYANVAGEITDQNSTEIALVAKKK